MSTLDKEALSKWVLATSALTTIAISPWWTYDPINIPKMSILFLMAFPIGVVVMGQVWDSMKRRDHVGITAMAFLGSIGLSFLFSNEDKIQQLYGASGRNTGVITLLGFMLIFLGFLYSVTPRFARDFTMFFIFTGVISGIYGAIQFLDLDPANWVNPYSPVIGFLGNPNFQSAFIGMNFVFLLSLIFANEVTKSWRLFAVFIEALYLFNVYQSKSQQGFLIILLGSTWVLFNRVKHSKYNRLGFPYLLLAGVGGIFTALGTLNIGPLSKFLYTDSVTYRGDYWRAGLRMFTENPVFGVGIDAYGAWYTRSRDLEATLRRGGNVVSSAAHNVYIDMASNGGIPLFLTYLLLNIFVFAAIIRMTRSLKHYDPFFIGISAAWFAFQAQSIISINQIGLSVWGWALSGSIIGYSRFVSQENSDFGSSSKNKSARKSTSRDLRVSQKFILRVFIGLLAGGAVSLPPYLAETRFMTSIQSGDASKIAAAAYIDPNTPRRMIQVASAFQENNLGGEALKIGLDQIAEYPDFLDGWKFLYQLPESSTAVKSQALNEIRRLDPLNPEFQ